MTHILPTPKCARFYEKNLLTAPRIYTACTEWLDAADAFSDYHRRLTGASLIFSEGGIELIRDPSLPKGSYRLDTTAASRLYASDLEGIQYALSTLLCLTDGRETASCVIEDAPDCPFRALMIDLARRWHPFDTLLEYVDLCWLYKIKYLHLHFIDSERYTLPTKLFPQVLIEGEHYTEEEISCLVRYAAARGIELIPEIELPGHGHALLAAYPDRLGCIGGEGRHNGLFCAGKDGLYDAVGAWIDEVHTLFPNSKYLHIGGDEAEVTHWKDCPDCRAYMEAHGINGPLPLYTHFIAKVTDLVLSKGLTPIVWEGFPKEGCDEISRDVIVVSWENVYHYTTDLLAEGFSIINASWQPLYVVSWLKDPKWDEIDIMAWDVYTWRNWWSKSIAYEHPVHVSPTDQVLGAQLCAWEDSYDGDIDAVRRRLAALSERTWNIDRVLSEEEFTEALERLLAIATRLKQNSI